MALNILLLYRSCDVLYSVLEFVIMKEKCCSFGMQMNIFDRFSII